MKLQSDVLPDFYKERECVISEMDAHLFCGRNLELRYFWNDLYQLTFNSRRNYAWLGHRKVGKTAYLARCYNIAFWEQEEVIPFYFAFDYEKIENQHKTVREVADAMAFTFVKQAVGFLLKRSDIAQANTREIFWRLLDKAATNPQYERICQVVHDEWESYEHEVDRAARDIPIELALRIAIGFVNDLHLHALLILDEAQEMVSSFLNEKGQTQDCVGSLATIVKDPRVWTQLSGSKVTMLAKDVVSLPLSNRVSRHSFDPLPKEEAFELIGKIIASSGCQAYSGIEESIYRMVGGHPYYILTLFKNNRFYNEVQGKPKSFRTPQTLREVFDFEVLHPKGELFNFWNDHFQQNLAALNDNPPKRKGLTFDVLRYILNNPKDTYPEQIAQAINTSIALAEKKVQQLERADLIQTRFRIVIKFADPILPMVLPKMQSDMVPKEMSEEQANAEILQIMTQRLAGLETSVVKLEKKSKSLQGQISVVKGESFEEAVREKIRQGAEEFGQFELLGPVESVIVRGKCQFDALVPVRKKTAGKGKSSGKAKKAGVQAYLAVEIKNLKNKVTLAQAKKFLSSLAYLKKERQIAEIIGAIISSTGFSDNAREFLARHKVILGSGQ